MNRFVKQNLLLIIVMSISSVVILALLVYSAIVYVQMSNCIEETDNLRKRITSLINNTPAPVEGNKPLIRQDIELYSTLNRNLSVNFGRPYQVAADRFIEVLMDVKKGESIEEARKKFIEEYQNSVGKDDNLARQGIALDEMRRKYRKTWDKALQEFVKLVTPLTQEPDMDTYAEEFAFFTIGIPRKMKNNFSNLQIYSRKYVEKVHQLLGAKMRPEADTLGFNFLEKPEMLNVSKNGTQTPSEDGGGNKFGIENIPVIAHHWDIIGDICKRISTVDVKSLNYFRIRGIKPENGAYDGTFVQQGNYQISHYTFEVTASMAKIRALAHAFAFDPAVKRVYIIRSVFLYAPDVEIAAARSLLKPDELQTANQEGKTENNAPARRGRRRGAIVEAEQETATVDKDKELRLKWLEEFKKREAGLPFYQRSGYGDIKLAGVDEYRAIFDVDYVELGGLY